MQAPFEIIRLQADSTAHDTVGAAVAIGNFDGVHIGHQAVIARMCDYANEHQLTPSVLTFYPHPRYYFRPDIAPFLLQHSRDKYAKLRDLGVQRIFVAHFNAALAKMAAQDFCEQLLFKTCNAKAVFTGENFFFGAARSGNIATLQALAAQHQIYSEALTGVTDNQHVCSSSMVRDALSNGDVRLAARLLNRPFALSGTVRKGDGRGSQIGFATANIMPRCYQMVPAYGVYAVEVRAASGKQYQGVANLGVRPTFGGDERPRLEVHLFDVREDFLGQRFEVRLIDYVRPETRFDGVEALKAQIAKDCEAAKDLLKAHYGSAGGAV